MNDEIKELLEKLKDNIPIEECRSEGTSDDLTHYEEDEDSWQYKLLDYITNLQQEKDDYKSRNEKAIEYVNTHKPSDTISFPLMKKDEENQVKGCFDYEFREIYQKDLLNILKGVSNENINKQ